MTGRLNSFLSMSALDGPGVRCVAFMQGCPLRCACCHNPDSWDPVGGTEITTLQLLQRVLRYRQYIRNGGVTVSGGEALIQAPFVAEFFAMCKRNGISTCLDTSGCVLDEDVIKVLENTDLCLLDIKMTNEEDYRKYTEGSLEQTLSFLEALDKMGVKTRIRQVIIPGINDSEEQVLKLKSLCSDYSCIEKIELLAFRKLCASKYEALGIDFPLSEFPETTPERIDELSALISEKHRV